MFKQPADYLSSQSLLEEDGASLVMDLSQMLDHDLPCRVITCDSAQFGDHALPAGR